MVGKKRENLTQQDDLQYFFDGWYFDCFYNLIMNRLETSKVLFN